MRLPLLILFFSTSLFTSAQTAQWANSIASEGYDEGLDMTTDQKGYVYVTGQIEFLAVFNDGYSLYSAGIHDIFVAKYDSMGTRIWAKRAGSRYGGEKAHSIVVDTSGNVYLCGEIDDTSYFDTIRVIGRPANNTFVAKYDSSGNALWVRHFETDSMNTRGYGICCDQQGNIYAIGATQGNCYYNGNLLLGTNGDYDAYVFKFDSNGNFNWIRQIGGASSDKAYGVITDGQNVYVTGYFAGSAEFSSTTASSALTLQSYGHTDFFLSKYDTSGMLLWAKQGGDTSFDRGWDITINSNGNIICTGEFSTHAQFDNQSVNGHPLMDMFIVAYDSSGNALWARDGGGPEDDIGRAVCHDTSGNLYVVGDYALYAQFDTNIVYGNGNSDIFFVSYDSLGNVRFIKSYGGSEFDRGRGVSVTASGDMYFCGDFNHDISFDNIYLVGDTNSDIFVVQLKNIPLCSMTASVVGNIPCHGVCGGTATVNATGQAPFSYEWSTSPPQNSATATNLCPASYSVIVTDTNGCQDTAFITLTDPQAIAVNATVTNATCPGCNNGNISVNVSGGVFPYTYQWNDGDTSEDRINLLADTFSLCVNDSNNCQVCDTFIVYEPTTDVTENISNLLFNLFPNPAKNSTFIKLAENIANTNYELDFYSTIGDKLMSVSVISTNQEISLNGFSPGIYYCRLINKTTGITLPAMPLIVN